MQRCLNHAGNIIRSVIAENGTQHDFIGIIDDRFVVITHADAADTVEAAVCQRFDEQVRAFYSFVDAERGGILVNEGQPGERLVPLMTIASQRDLPIART